MIVLCYSDVTCRAADPVERDRQEDTAHWYTCLSVQLSVPLTSSLSVCLSPVCLSVSSGVYSLTDVVTVVTDSRGTDSGKPLPLQVNPNPNLLPADQPLFSVTAAAPTGSPLASSKSRPCLIWPCGHSDQLTELLLVFQVVLQGQRAC